MVDTKYVRRTMSNKEKSRHDLESISKFIIRARRISLHSMVVSGEIKKLSTASLNLAFSETGHLTIRWDKPSDEERFESLAARLRPFTLKSEPVYLANVLSAIKELSPIMPNGRQATELSRHEEWFLHRFVNKDSNAYGIQLFNPDGTPRTNLLPDSLLAESWLYADLVHFSPNAEREEGLNLRYDERYKSASYLYSELATHVIEILDLVRELFHPFGNSIISSAWTEQVTDDARGQSVECSRAVFAPTFDQISNVGAWQFEQFSYSNFRSLAEPAKGGNLILLDDAGSELESYPAFLDSSTCRSIIYVDSIAKLQIEKAADNSPHERTHKPTVSITPLFKTTTDTFRSFIRSVAEAPRIAITFPSLDINLEFINR